MLICEKCRKECFLIPDKNNNGVSSCCKEKFSDQACSGVMGIKNDAFQKSNPNSAWTTTCERGHVYESCHHFSFCPECYAEIPEWAKKIMRTKISQELFSSNG